MSDYMEYHKRRGNRIYQVNIHVPEYITHVLPRDKKARILDVGCGNGSFLLALRSKGYNNLFGIDLDENAVRWVKRNGIGCELCSLSDYNPIERYDYVSMNHVLEHLPKESVIPILKHIKDDILSPGGSCR